MKQLSFRQESIRETVVEALQFIGIKELNDFDLKKEYFNYPKRGNHDARHLYRTMIASALIAQELDKSREGLLAFCGAFIHDLAQKTDGDGKDHGPRAARTKWNMFNRIWDKYELTEEERENVRAAVSRHSGSRRKCGYTENKLVNQILHDADALDRCRFHRHGRLDWSYLSVPEITCQDGHPSKALKNLIGETEAVCAATKFLPSFFPFKDFLENIR